MKSNPSLTDFQEEVWKYHTKIYHDTGTSSITVFKIADHFNKSNEEVQEALEALAEEGIEDIPPNWAFLHSSNLIRERIVADLEPKKKPEKKPENESPPPKDNFDSIFQSISERETQEENSESNFFTEDQLKAEREKAYKTAQAHARNEIRDYHLESLDQFQQCQSCGAPETEVVIPDLENPELINLLCHSCVKKGKTPPPISLRLAKHKKYSDSEYYDIRANKKNKRKNANVRKRRLKKKYDHLMDPLNCQRCGVSETDARINLKLIDPDRPYHVVPLCSTCMQKHIHEGKYTDDYKTISLLELIGVHVPSRLSYFEYEILREIRKENHAVLSCYVCGKTLEESHLHLGQIDEHNFFLACSECMPTARIDIIERVSDREATTIFL